MATLRDRLRPMAYLCHAYGMGYCRDGGFRAAGAVHYTSIAFNLWASAYTYYDVHVFAFNNLVMMHDLTTVVSVARLLFRFAAPVAMIASLAANGGAAVAAVESLDRLVPSVRGAPLTAHAYRFAAWMAAAMIAELLQILVFHVRTDFAFSSARVTAQFVFTNVWLVTPVLVHTFLMTLVRCGVRDINAAVDTTAAWRARCADWKELRRLGAELTNRTFGVIIVVSMVCTIAEMSFFCFAVYLAWREQSVSEISCYALIMAVRSGFTLYLFRTCHECKAEVRSI